MQCAVCCLCRGVEGGALPWVRYPESCFYLFRLLPINLRWHRPFWYLELTLHDYSIKWPKMPPFDALNCFWDHFYLRGLLIYWITTSLNIENQMAAWLIRQLPDWNQAAARSKSDGFLFNQAAPIVISGSCQIKSRQLPNLYGGCQNKARQLLDRSGPN